MRVQVLFPGHVIYVRGYMFLSYCWKQILNLLNRNISTLTLRFYIMLTLSCSFVLVTWFIMLQSFFGYRLSEDDVGE
jgi:TRAP-type C4-dicarboxylate transport system permease small subunit